jgi:hypothetical protein
MWYQLLTQVLSQYGPKPTAKSYLPCCLVVSDKLDSFMLPNIVSKSLNLWVHNLHTKSRLNISFFLQFWSIILVLEFWNIELGFSVRNKSTIEEKGIHRNVFVTYITPQEKRNQIWRGPTKRK